jgi:hypothetical protein
MCSFDIEDEFQGIDHNTYGTPESFLLKKNKECWF